MNANDIYQGRKFTVYGTRGVEATILECDYKGNNAIIFRDTPFDCFAIVYNPEIYRDELIWNHGFYARTLRELTQIMDYYTHTETWWDVSDEEYNKYDFREEHKNEVVFGMGYTLYDYYEDHGEIIITLKEPKHYTYETKDGEIRHIITKN